MTGWLDLLHSFTAAFDVFGPAAAAADLLFRGIFIYANVQGLQKKSSSSEGSLRAVYKDLLPCPLPWQRFAMEDVSLSVRLAYVLGRRRIALFFNTLPISFCSSEYNRYSGAR